MNPEKRSAHIIAYYLSRFDKQALISLGFKTDRQAFEETALRLGVKPNYIKFRRDEFDVEYPHRKGWHKREKSSSIISILNTFSELDFLSMESIVKEILSGSPGEIQSKDVGMLLRVLEEDAEDKIRPFYVSRTLTGRNAEEAFMKWFYDNPHYFGTNGILTDRRDHGCGYDFKLALPGGKELAIEVKGLSADQSGILLTSKEWDTARVMKEDYYLALISNLEDNPVVELIADPFSCFAPKRNLQAIVRVSWTLSAKQMRKYRNI
jgi:hypothetical protein